MTHEEEYIMLNEVKCSVRCSGIGARKYYYYDCEYQDKYNRPEYSGDYNLKNLVKELNLNASPDNNIIYINKRDKYSGQIRETYKYTYNPYYRIWEKR